MTARKGGGRGEAEVGLAWVITLFGALSRDLQVTVIRTALERVEGGVSKQGKPKRSRDCSILRLAIYCVFLKLTI